MPIRPVPVEHPEVRKLVPTWHCVLRFRERARVDGAREELMEALRAALAEADITRWPPAWIAGRHREAELLAVAGELAFPLARSLHGTWAATTCLRR
jgi:hypothetical protein